ncbi:Uncharacterised protein [Yokenella regensburgei]|nr:Uncharacterised protein [Yokenella regensburgei]
MKRLLTTAALAATLFSGLAFAADPVIPWAVNSGDTESTHIAGVGQDLNAQHQAVTKTQEGVWAAKLWQYWCRRSRTHQLKTGGDWSSGSDAASGLMVG